MSSNDPITLKPAVVSDDVASRLDEGAVANLNFRVVTDADDWLSAAYGVLETTFEPSLLDPLERYREWLEMNRQGTHPFPFLMVVAVSVREGGAHVVGVIAGNIMAMADETGEPPLYIAAIGHQVTAASIRAKGLKGVGRRLWQAWSDEASRWVSERGGTLQYSVLEAETDSVGFWDRVGYRWPQGVRYWQPPLEFDDAGNYIHPEEPVILMLRPLAEPADHISRALVAQIVETLYRNWSLAKYKDSLAPEAFQRAEQYVMGVVYQRILRIMPEDETLRLIRIPMDEAMRGGRRHVRSVALSQGVQHGLRPLKAIRSSDINDFDDLLQAMNGMAFGARTLGHAADVLHAMMSDRDCRVVLTLSGAVSVAKLDLMLAELVERGMIHAIVTTGAIVCHGFNSERGSAHFVAPEDRDDTWLFEHGYNRIYDTIETEYALDELQEIVHTILKDVGSQTVASSDLVRMLGEYLVNAGMNEGLLQAAYRRNVPIFIPAFTDSEIGLDFALFNHYRRASGKPEVRFDPFIDFERYTQFASGTTVRGIITLGGGVPRNWAQQIGPYLDAIERADHAVAVNSARFKYGLRICPDPAFWGGLSGCTYSEGVSWGKFVAPDEGGMLAEVLSDFTFVLPILIKGLFQRLDKRK